MERRKQKKQVCFFLASDGSQTNATFKKLILQDDILEFNKVKKKKKKKKSAEQAETGGKSIEAHSRTTMKENIKEAPLYYHQKYTVFHKQEKTQKNIISQVRFV
jgi:hypothetical protein